MRSIDTEKLIDTLMRQILADSQVEQLRPGRGVTADVVLDVFAERIERIQRRFQRNEDALHNLLPRPTVAYAPYQDQQTVELGEAFDRRVVQASDTAEQQAVDGDVVSLIQFCQAEDREISRAAAKFVIQSLVSPVNAGGLQVFSHTNGRVGRVSTGAKRSASHPEVQETVDGGDKDAVSPTDPHDDFLIKERVSLAEVRRSRFPKPELRKLYDIASEDLRANMECWTGSLVSRRRRRELGIEDVQIATLFSSFVLYDSTKDPSKRKPAPRPRTSPVMRTAVFSLGRFFPALMAVLLVVAGLSLFVFPWKPGLQDVDSSSDTSAKMKPSSEKQMSSELAILRARVDELAKFVEDHGSRLDQTVSKADLQLELEKRLALVDHDTLEMIDRLARAVLAHLKTDRPLPGILEQMCGFRRGSKEYFDHDWYVYSIAEQILKHCLKNNTTPNTLLPPAELSKLLSISTTSVPRHSTDTAPAQRHPLLDRLESVESAVTDLKQLVTSQSAALGEVNMQALRDDLATVHTRMAVLERGLVLLNNTAEKLSQVEKQSLSAAATFEMAVSNLRSDLTSTTQRVGGIEREADALDTVLVKFRDADATLRSDIDKIDVAHLTNTATEFQSFSAVVRRDIQTLDKRWQVFSAKLSHTQDLDDRVAVVERLLELMRSTASSSRGTEKADRYRPQPPAPLGPSFSPSSSTQVLPHPSVAPYVVNWGDFARLNSQTYQETGPGR